MHAMGTQRMKARAIAKRSLQRRLIELETRARINSDPPPVISVVFVDAAGRCPSDQASELGGNLVWYRKEHELQEDLECRVMDAVPKRNDLNASVVIFWPAKHDSLEAGYARSAQGA